jgi:hypothetical protein
MVHPLVGNKDYQEYRRLISESKKAKDEGDIELAYKLCVEADEFLEKTGTFNNI